MASSALREVAAMAAYEDLRSRIVAGAAMLGIPAPDLWVTQRIWLIVGRYAWANAWAGRLPSATNSDAISDAWITGALRSVRDAEGGNADV